MNIVIIGVGVGDTDECFTYFDVVDYAVKQSLFVVDFETFARDQRKESLRGYYSMTD